MPKILTAPRGRRYPLRTTIAVCYLSTCIAESRQLKHFLAACAHTIHLARGNTIHFNLRGKYMTTQHVIRKDIFVKDTFSDTHER